MTRYLLSRMGINPASSVSILDEHRLADVIDTLDRVGSFVVGGFSKTWMSAANLDRCYSDILAKGYATLVDNQLEAGLQQAYEGYLSSGDSRTPTLTRAYGWFFHWLNYAGGADFSRPIFETVVNHAYRHFPINSRVRRKFDLTAKTVTLGEAARQCGLSQWQMRSILLSLGKAPERKNAGRPIHLDPEEIDEINQVLKDSTNFKGLKRMLGTGHGPATRIVEAKFISPYIKGMTTARHEYLFRKVEIEKFLEVLIGSAPTVKRIPTETLSLPDACHAYAVPIEMACRALVSREIASVGRLRGKHGLCGILISRKDALTLKRTR